jgi:hypothetical protein
MSVRRFIFGTIGVALIAATVFVISAAAKPQASMQKLIGTVGKNNAYKITMADAGGKVIKTLKAGTYSVTIHDDSAIHNYELDGPHGKSWTFTAVPFKGTKTVTLKLVAGKYKAYCAAHESTMFQHFTVT